MVPSASRTPDAKDQNFATAAKFKHRTFYELNMKMINPISSVLAYYLFCH